MKKVQIQDCTIYHGDCAEVLESLEPGSVSCAWSDPPYGIGFRPTHRKVLAIPDMLANDEKPHTEFIAPIVKTVKDGGAVYLCTRFDVASQWVDALEATGVKVKNPIYWVKPLGSQGDCLGDRSNCVEIVLFAHVGRHLLRGKREMNAWTISKPEPSIHPTPKPVELVRRCIQASSDPGDLVLDPFLGGGTTAVACVLTGRRFIGVELDQRYFELSCERIERAYRDVNSRLPGFDPVSMEQRQLFEVIPQESV
ncbi:MAG: site-specific DNA-methyltransferase [Planctomycetaceae bacterium]|nr:site-specific DNA-methyltransferase [Planctomycetaceae bacterium]